MNYLSLCQERVPIMRSETYVSPSVTLNATALKDHLSS